MRRPRGPSIAALFAVLSACARSVPETQALRLHYVASASQFGPVSYRDPLGALSPDGRWLGYSVQERLYLQPLPAGALITVAGEPGPIVHLAWTRDAGHLAIDRRGVAPRWRNYDLKTGVEVPLWRPGLRLHATSDSGRKVEVSPDSLRQLAWAPESGRIAGVREVSGGSELWSFAADDSSAEVLGSAARLSYPAFAPGGRIACLSYDETVQIISLPCGDPKALANRVEAYGPLGFSPDGETLFYAAPDRRAALALFAAPATLNVMTQLTTFARDAYAPSVAADGSILFKTQSYRTVVGVVPASGGAVRLLSAFQSETPSWDPTGKWIGVTYGTWRRVADDFRYPDIAQDLGLIGVDPDTPARVPAQVIANSPSEDQSMAWSPNGKWIAFHSHREHGDDIWLVPADLSSPPRRITSFGGGAEAGWPRWSPDGNWLAVDAAPRAIRPVQSTIYVLGMDQQGGQVTTPAHPVSVAGAAGEAVHAEWADTERLVILQEESPGHWALLLVPRAGGADRVVHRWTSEHRFAGHGVSPEGDWVAFIAPGGDGHFQVFRIATAGGEPEQLTFDPSNKSQPAYSPDGRRIALTIWEYQVQFWILR